MTIKQCYNDISEKLATIYPLEESRQIVSYLFEYYCGITRSDRIVYPTREIVTNSSFDIALERVLKGEPIQYVIGEAEFCGNIFKVNSSVLIPRVETEELVNWVVSESSDMATILDIGTGSGVISISLALCCSTANVSACDISSEALRVALGNSELLGADNVNFFKCDILNDTLLGSYDVIVSNPPYICEQEKSLMRSNVLNYEPSIALFVPDQNPLLFYDVIATKSLNALNSGGALYFEINEAYGKEVVKMLIDKGYRSVVLKKDIHDKDRMVKAVR